MTTTEKETSLAASDHVSTRASRARSSSSARENARTGAAPVELVSLLLPLRKGAHYFFED